MKRKEKKNKPKCEKCDDYEADVAYAAGDILTRLALHLVDGLQRLNQGKRLRELATAARDAANG